MRLKGTIITVFTAFMVMCSAAASDVFGQKVEHPPGYIGPPIVEQEKDREARYPIDRQPARHKKDAHGYRNYGQYRRTQVGNRRYRYVNRYYWNDGVRVSRRVRVYF